MPDDLVSVRYIVDDVDAAIDFYTEHFGFTVLSSAPPAFADVVRGRLRLLLSGPASSAGRPMPDGRSPEPGGWNRIHLIVEDIATDVDRLRMNMASRAPHESSTSTTASDNCRPTGSLAGLPECPAPST